MNVLKKKVIYFPYRNKCFLLSYIEEPHKRQMEIKSIYICRIGASQDLGALEITKEWVKLRVFLVRWCGWSWRI